MEDRYQDIRRVLLCAVDFINRLGMMEARVARAGASGVSLEIPNTPEKEVTAEMKDSIFALRKRNTDFEWLYPDGPRDQLCVRFGLTRDQVAGVLAADTRKRADSNGNGVNGQVPDQAPAQATQGEGGQTITSDAITWPVRVAGDGNHFIPREREYPVDEVDRLIAELLIKNNMWDKKHTSAFSGIRRLTVQQVAGLRAAISRKAKKS